MPLLPLAIRDVWVVRYYSKLSAYSFSKYELLCRLGFTIDGGPHCHSIEGYIKFHHSVEGEGCSNIGLGQFISGVEFSLTQTGNGGNVAE